MAQQSFQPQAGGLSQKVRRWENFEFRSNADVEGYAELTRQISMELYLRAHANAASFQTKLSKYRGRWYHFGLASPIKARLCASFLRLGAWGFQQSAQMSVKFAVQFERQFVEPERQAKSGRRKKEHRPDFEINA